MIVSKGDESLYGEMGRTKYMKNNVFCSAFGISAFGNKIWGSAYDFNEIYEIDLLSHKMRSLGPLEGEDDTTNLVEFIEYCSDKILFVPGSNGRYFHVLDIKTGKQTKVLKNMLSYKKSKNGVNRFFSFIWGNRAYVIRRDELSMYCYDFNKSNFETVFEDDKYSTFKCMSFSVWNAFVAFLSIDLNEIAIYNLHENSMEQIKLSEKMVGVNRIAITEDRIVLYRIEDKKVYLLDRKGALIKEYTILSETGNRIMMFPSKESVYLIGLTSWANEIFKIDSNENIEKLHLNNMDNSNVYCLNRIDDVLYLYEFMSLSKNISRLNYNAGKCFKYKLGTNTVKTVEWDIKELEYESKIIDMLKEGICLFEMDAYNIEFMIKNVNVQQDREHSENINIGEKIYNGFCER